MNPLHATIFGALVGTAVYFILNSPTFGEVVIALIINLTAGAIGSLIAMRRL